MTKRCWRKGRCQPGEKATVYRVDEATRAVCVEVKVLLGGGGLARAWVVESNWLLTRQTRKGEEVHAIGCTPNSTPSDSLTFREDR